MKDLLQVVKARAHILGAVMLATIALVGVVSHFMPKTYVASAAMVLNHKGVDPVSGSALSAQFVPVYMATQVDIVASRAVALKVVDRLRLADIPSVKEEFFEEGQGRGDIRNWLADLLLERLEVRPSRESSVLRIDFSGTDPEFAAQVANAFASEYQQVAVQLKLEPMRAATSYFTQQIGELRGHVEAAWAQLSRFQEENNIIRADDRLDVEVARLKDLSTQLVAVQAMRMDAASRQAQVAGGGRGESPDVLGSPIVQSLKASLMKAEASLSDLGLRLGENHPKFQAAKAEANKLRAQLGESLRTASGSIAGNARIQERREAELAAAVEAQRTKVLALNRTHDRIGMLEKDVENAQRAYDAAIQRLNQISLEGQSGQADVSILNRAVPPREAARPRMALNLVVATFLGAFLGLGIVLLAELSDRRIRTASGLANELGGPVLGVVPGGRAQVGDARGATFAAFAGHKR